MLFQTNSFLLGVFLDLSKAFDTSNYDFVFVNQKITVREGDPWTCRRQIVSYNTHHSSEELISCGVPKGGINVICWASDVISSCSFADGTSIIHSHHTVDMTIEIFGIQLAKVSDWLVFNKLSINLLIILYFVLDNTKFLGLCTADNLSWNTAMWSL